MTHLAIDWLALVDTFLRLLAAVSFGALIGFERQWRQRMAGLRTNALVALGAASFTVFATLTPDEISPTRVAAQVVSGIGFLGAGVILREGLNVRGLNSAATLWCAAAVGLLAGGAHYVPAAMTTVLIVGTNLFLRPIVRHINTSLVPPDEIELRYRVKIRARASDEAHVRALLLQGVAGTALHLERLESRDVDDGTRVEVIAGLRSQTKGSAVLETLVGRLSLESGVSAASWSVVEGEAPD
ncbi:MgtC/SapB family protein [Salinarimonas sp.]|uniref:MgtC/SapB family protein n=1 Tax=Salinarimonas sp. TaxID=2766526 RepID=UPI00391D50C2